MWDVNWDFNLWLWGQHVSDQAMILDTLYNYIVNLYEDKTKIYKKLRETI